MEELEVMALQTILFGVFVVPKGKMVTRSNSALTGYTPPAPAAKKKAAPASRAGRKATKPAAPPKPKVYKKRPTPLRDKIIATMTKYPGLTSRQMAIKAGLTLQSVRSHLSKMDGNGEIIVKPGIPRAAGMGGRPESFFYLKGAK